jgi:hypothetical protein
LIVEALAAPRALQRLLAIVLATVLLVAQSAHATVGIVIRTPDEIVVGTDTKVLAINQDGSVRDAGYACKLRRLGPRRFVALAGFQEGAGLNLGDFVVDTFRLRSDDTDPFRLMPRAIGKALAHVFRGATPGTYADFARRERITTVAFLYVDEYRNSNAQVYNFQPTIDAKNRRPTMTTSACPPDCASGFGHVVLGERKATDAIESRLRANPSYPYEPRDGGIVAAVQSLLQTGVDASPIDCGGQIDIARLRSAGADRVYSSEECKREDERAGATPGP